MSIVTYENSDSDSAPTALGFEKLNLHPILPSLSHLSTGLIAFSGRTGAGKTTSQAALIKRIHETRDLRIMTVEDPIEVNYGPGKSRIIQYAVGQDAFSFSAGAKLALRTEPDVLQIGELRDPETAELAIYQAAHRLVITSLHCSSDVDTYQRLLDLIPVSDEGVPSVSLNNITLVIVHQEWETNAADQRVLKARILAR
jgi:twitching motility protein PilT